MNPGQIISNVKCTVLLKWLYIKQQYNTNLTVNYGNWTLELYILEPDENEPIKTMEIHTILEIIFLEAWLSIYQDIY